MSSPVVAYSFPQQPNNNNNYKLYLALRQFEGYDTPYAVFVCFRPPAGGTYLPVVVVVVGCLVLLQVPTYRVIR